MADIFISYSKAFHAVTEALAEELQAKGFSVWWDTALVSGESFRDAIVTELGRARAVIVIWSTASVKSDWVISEAGRARARGILIPVRNEDVSPQDIPPPFDILHTDVVTNRPAILAALARLGVVPSAPPPAPKLVEETPAPWAALSDTTVAEALALEHWQAIKGTSDPARLREFVAEFGAASVARLARDRLADMEASAWEALPKTKRADALRAWLTKFPDGAHAQVAEAELSGLSRAEDEQALESAKEPKPKWRPTRRLALAGGAIGVWAIGTIIESEFRRWKQDPATFTPVSTKTDPAQPKLPVLIGTPVRTFTGHSAGVRAVAIAPDGSTALSGSDDNTLKLWDIASGRELRTFRGHTYPVRAVAITPDGRTAVSACQDTTTKVWEMSSGRALRTFKGHAGFVFTAAIGPDGRTVLSGDDDKLIKVWDLANGRDIRTLRGHTDSVLAVAIAPDGRTALSGGSDRTLKLWEISSGRELRTFEGHTRLIRSIAIGADGLTALSASDDGTLKLWELSSGREIRTFQSTDCIYAVAVAPDGRTALSGSLDKTLTLWEVATGRALRTFTGHSSTIDAVAFSPDGRTGLSGSWDNTLKLWDLSAT